MRPLLLVIAALAFTPGVASAAEGDGKLPLPWAIAASVVLSLVVSWLWRRKR